MAPLANASQASDEVQIHGRCLTNSLAHLHELSTFFTHMATVLHPLAELCRVTRFLVMGTAFNVLVLKALLME